MKWLMVLVLVVSTAEAREPKKPTGSKKSSLSAAQQQNLNKLKGDLQSLYKKSSVTQAQKQAVANDLKNILSGANKPSQQSVTALANDLTKAVADGAITPQEAIQLSEDIAEVLNSANISQQQVQKLMADVQALLKATNLTKQDMQLIYNDVKAIVSTAQQNVKTKKSK